MEKKQKYERRKSDEEILRNSYIGMIISYVMIISVLLMYLYKVISATDFALGYIIYASLIYVHKSNVSRYRSLIGGIRNDA